MVVWAFVRLRRDGPSLLDLCFAAAGLALVVLTVSRGAMLATAVACALYTIRRRRVVETFALALIALGVPLLVYGFQGDIVKFTGGYLTRGQDTEELFAMTGRLPLYIYLVTEQFPSHPFIGVGFEMLSEAGIRPSELPSITISGDKAQWVWHPSHAHNALIHTLVGTGIIGLGLFLIGWGKVAWNVYVLSRMDFSVGEEAWFVLIYIFAHAMIDTTLTATVDPPFIVASFICALATLVPERRHPSLRDRPIQRWAGIAT
jgi:O-antigen ligase